MNRGPFRLVVVAAFGLLPASRLKNSLLSLVGFQVHKTAVVQPCLILNVDSIVLEENSVLGGANILRDLALLHLAESSRIGRWNWISASRPLRNSGGRGSLELGAHSALTQRHYLDCSGGVTIGAYSTIAGVRSTFITHGIDWRSSRQTFAPISIGDYCLVSSNSAFTPGATVPSKSVVGMGSVVSRGLDRPGLILSDRAQTVRPELAGEYFARKTGYIDQIGQ